MTPTMKNIFGEGFNEKFRKLCNKPLYKKTIEENHVFHGQFLSFSYADPESLAKFEKIAAKATV